MSSIKRGPTVKKSMILPLALMSMVTCYAQINLDVEVAIVNEDPVQVAMIKEKHIIAQDTGEHVLMKVIISKVSPEGEPTIIAEPLLKQEWGKYTTLHFENGDEIRIVATH
jgi:hypothetical protein